MCNNGCNNTLFWLIILLILFEGFGGNGLLGLGNGGCGGGCGCGCN